MVNYIKHHFESVAAEKIPSLKCYPNINNVSQMVRENKNVSIII